jgi:hypothetical protein
MRILSALFVLVLFCVNTAFAQKDASGPVVSYPVYFDVSPPLRDMVKMNEDKADMTWKDGVVKNHLVRPGYNRSDKDATFTDPIRQWWNGNIVTDTTIANFDGVSANSGVCPPDTDGDVGPDHWFATVNLKYAIYSKTGSLLFGPANNSSVWSGMPNNSNDGDPIVLYDEQADRWLFTQFSLPNYPNGPFFMMIAVSQTPDPTGSWYRYQYSFTDMPDYPKFGIWPDGYYMSMNRFSSGSMNFVGIGAVAFDRTKMIAGDLTAGMILFTLPQNNPAWRMLPADCDSDFPPTGTPEYFGYLNDGANKIRFYHFTTDWTTPANSTFTQGEEVLVTALDGIISGGIPQKGTSVKLSDMAGSFMNRLPFRKYTDHWSVAACATIDVGSNTAGIRWWELRKAQASDPWIKYQEGTFAPADGHHRWMGSIALDEDNNIALGYSISSSTLYPSIRYTGRLNGDPLGEMTIQESGIMNGGGSQTNTWSGTPSRWGDYSRMACDPSSPNTFWYTQEYYQTTSQANWRTRVGSFSFADLLTVTSTATPDSICLGGSSQLNVEASGGSGTFTYSWTSDPAGFTSSIQNPLVSPVVTTRYFVDVNDGTITRTDSVDVTVSEPPVAFAGNDTVFCSWMSKFPVEGSGSFLGTTEWTTAGDGAFDDAAALVTNYTPGPGDRSAGNVTLALTAQPLAPCTGASADEIVILIDPCTGIPDPATLKLGLQVSPNPTSGVFKMTITNGNKGPVELVITDVTGRTVLQQTMTFNKQIVSIPVDLGKQPDGIYIVKLKSDHETQTEKVVVN